MKNQLSITHHVERMLFTIFLETFLVICTTVTAWVEDEMMSQLFCDQALFKFVKQIFVTICKLVHKLSGNKQVSFNWHLLWYYMDLNLNCVNKLGKTLEVLPHAAYVNVVFPCLKVYMSRIEFDIKTFAWTTSSPFQGYLW